MTGSNRRPPACKAGALPAELHPRPRACRPAPTRTLVGLDGLEPSTPALSRRCSNQLSYRPKPDTSYPGNARVAGDNLPTTDKCERSNLTAVSRKEVIQPHLPIRLPCYDFTPVIRPAFDGSLFAVRPPASGISDSHGVTGGVYKTRERIHRIIADIRLLAIPASWSRVADSNLN